MSIKWTLFFLAFVAFSALTGCAASKALVKDCEDAGAYKVCEIVKKL